MDLDKEELEATKNMQSSAESAEMNEEEIIIECNKLLITLKKSHIDGKIIQILYDLYEQEKEKNEELEEYKKISELTKISCCTAQNCEALNNAIREGLENQKLRDKLEESEARLQEEINEVCKLKAELYGNSISKDKIREQIKQIKSEEANIYFKEHVVYFLQELLEEE